MIEKLLTVALDAARKLGLRKIVGSAFCIFIGLFIVLCSRAVKHSSQEEAISWLGVVVVFAGGLMLVLQVLRLGTEPDEPPDQKSKAPVPRERNRA